MEAGEAPGFLLPPEAGLFYACWTNMGGFRFGRSVFKQMERLKFVGTETPDELVGEDGGT